MEDMESRIKSYLKDVVREEDWERVSAEISEMFQDYDVRERRALEAVRRDNYSIMNEYLETKRCEGCSAGTIRNYRYIMNLFFAWCRKDMKDIVANDIRSFLMDYREKHDVMDRTMDKYREICCWFFGWCHEEGIIPTNPARNVRPIKHEERERKALTRMQLEIIKDACQNIRERAIVEFLASTACRVQELCDAKRDDINLSERTVTIWGKGKRERRVLLSDRCIITLQKYLETRTDDSVYIFVSERKPYRQCTKGSIEKLLHSIQGRTGSMIHVTITPHIIRHTAATLAMESGMKVQEIQRCLGHKKIDTTMRYAHVSMEDVASSHRKHVF